MDRQRQQQLSQQQQQTSQTSQQFSSSQQTMSRTETRQITQQRVVGNTQQVIQQQTGGRQQILIPVLPGGVSPPIFEQIFRNARFAQGGNALFEGKVVGNPKPTVSWTRKGVRLMESHKYKMTYNDQTGIVTLLINKIGPGDEGEYTCTAVNQYGEAICSVFIQPEGFPAPQQQQQQSYSKEVYQHTEKYSNGHVSTIEDFKVDTFEYRLLREVSFRESITRRYINETDTEISTIVERGPIAPPQIQQKPRNSKLLEGADAVFTAKVAANPKPRLTWFRNGQRLVQNEKYESIYSNNQASLRVRNAQGDDSGHYTLLAENPQGCVVSSAYLAIEPTNTQEGIIRETTMKSTQQQYETTQTEAGKSLPPNFVRVCSDREVTEGKMTRFDCRVTGRPYPEVTWYINGRQVADDATHKILVNESGNHALMITNVSRADAGIVTCIARNKSGETSFQCNFGVIEKEQVVAPKFVERFTTVNVKEGEPVTLHARAVGTPIPRITWQKDGVSIVSSPELRITVDGGATTLDISRAKASDAAWYQCTAQNVAGSTATRARLFVETPQIETSEPWRLHLPRPTKVIEPEPAPGPEVIYLRHVDRPKPHLPQSEDDKIYPPPQFIIPLQNVVQVEGGRVHFEARIEPVGDPTMRVDWYLNGKPLEASSRTTITFRFGFVALDLISIVLADSGEYTCVVTSATGQVQCSAILSVQQRSTIERSSQHPDSLQYIQQLEDYSKYQRSESIEESYTQKPQFIRPLHDLGDLQEGRNAHFEAQLTPVSDPTMKVEWYKDGYPITASSRITTIFNFGYVSLNIMHLRAEDAGLYTVRAVNRMGEAVCNSSLKVITRTSVTADLGIPEQQRYIEKVEELEAYQQQLHSKYVQEQPESISPPEFKSPIKDQINIREGGFAHFEARLEPIGDSTLRVEWLKDGRPVEASSRITTFFNFGYVALTIKYVTIHDIGNYTCRAYNALGQATTTAQLSVLSKNDIIFDSQHPGGLQKIQTLEDSSRYQRKSDEEVTVTQKPRFLGPLKGTTKIVEGQRAHFEIRVEPQNDLTMKIEWYFNGKAIMSANRIQTYHDFGYVALDILGVRAEDTGTYTVVARNALGEAQMSTTMQVETRSSIDTSSMHHTSYEKTRQLESGKFVEPQYHIEEISKSKPIFVQPLSDPKPINEGKNIHLEGRLEPMGDPTMRVEWFCNGRPITVGSRFRTYYDFGFVALDIVHATALDSGEYTCRATNHLGSSHSSACVRVVGRSDIVTETQNEQSLEQIQMLEDASRYRKHISEDVQIVQAPQFTRPLHNIETIEGTNIHMECRLQPVGDPSMRVEWFVNGFPVKTGHRFRPAYDFDYVALDLLSVYPADSGVYTCQARNQLGEAVTSCSVRVIAKKDLLLETHHASGLEKIQYLEDSSRYKKSEYVDEVVNVKPKFLTKPKSLENMREGQHAHFECKLEPVTDPNLKVEWYKNGRPVTIGHRFRPIHDFGYVALDIVDLIAEDSGVYTCRAVNLVGTDETTVSLKCRGTAQIITGTQNEQGLEQIHYLEDRTKYQRSEISDEITKQAPIFTTSLKNIEIKEGQRAHFECRLIPVSDSTMKVEWFHNNVPVKSGSRFTETNNFGFVALDIMCCYPEDAGIYTCRATNALGEAVTSASCVVHSKKSIYMESQHEGALNRLRTLEDSSRYKRTSAVEETVTQAPVFTLPIRDLRVAENQAAHFEARLIPVGDSRLKVEWLRNGVPIEASNRLTTMHDFGYVALNMKYVNPEDSGTYTCRATNDLGEAVTSATLFVQSKASLQLETQHETALQKIHQLEDSTKYQRREEDEIIVTQAPRFVTQLNGPTNLVESQSAHYECRIEPYPDPNLKVEWFCNGQPLQTGHRFRTAYDFGFASLDVLTVYGEDTGEYTCKATNRLGTAQSSIKLNVKSRSSIILDTQHEGALQKIQYLEDDSKYKRTGVEDQIIIEKPQFGRPLKSIENLPEGKSAHLEATLTPVNDPTMRVEWYCNGRPIPNGHRFKTTYDFGFVALDILYAYAEDSGTYMCKARNAAGEAVTTCAINVKAKSGLLLDTLDEQRLQKIRDLEAYEQPQKQEIEPDQQKPIFLTPLVSLENLKEGDHAHLECRVTPVNDPNLKIEWFINGIAIRASHRFRTTHDFGYVALDILYVWPEDTGTYICKATNLVGEAVNTCNIKVATRRSILLESHHPDGLEKIRELEAQGHPQRLEVEEPIPTPPRFITELRGTTSVFEGQTAHFECQVDPIHDPNLRIEFFHNGKSLPSASRFHITFDFGYVALDISHCVPEDAGEYSVKAINNLGQCTSSINLRVTAKGNIILDSQRPEGLEKIRQLEEQTPYKRPEIPDPQTRQRPVFTQPLQNIDNIIEGQVAHFECRLIPVGDPTLKVEWFRNEKILEDSSRITKVHDFGFVSLDITHIRDDDEGVYMCRASNALGEAVTTASMRIKTKASIQLETQHPEGMRRIQQLEQPTQRRSEERDRVFEKPIFTQLLTGPSELWEGQHARFECRVVPVGDPNLRFEWFVNGVELKMGSRFRVTHDFGYVTLDINSVVTEDSGVYMCKAINLAGEAVTSTSLKVRARSAIAGEPLQPDAWQKIQLKEAEMNRVPEMFVETTPQQAPVFTTHLKSYDNLAEGQHVYLEAQVEPRTDPNLRVEWFKNGISLTTGTRIRSTFDFGLVSLSINGLRQDDSAIYTCKATNLLGEAVSTCTLKIADHHWLIDHSLHPDAMPIIEALEKPSAEKPAEPEPTYESPVVISHLNNVECTEGDNVHFECTVEPSKDPTLRIEWFVNGKPLPSGARYKTVYDFGYVSLDINHSYEEDSGIYTCKAINSKGSATTSGSLRCTSKESIYRQTQHPQGKAGLEAVEETEQELANRYKPKDLGADHEFPKPIWTTPLQPEFSLGEAQPLHLEATVEPKEDPDLKIEWFFNGKSLDHGSRFKMTSEFGFVTLDLTEVYERDQGIYTCKAWNKSGEAYTSTTIYCSTKENLIERTQHPKGKEGLEAIQDLEDSLKRPEGAPADSEDGHAPKFTSQPQDLSNLSEGEIAHFEASLTPTGDQTMKVEWFYNGEVLKASHRTRTVYAFGMVVLEILGTKIEDTGTYTCRATNKWGKDEISVNLECVEKTKGQKPKFTTQIQNIEGLKDGESAHFECTLIPVNDPKLKVEWFHNGQPLLQSSRIKSVSDFGFVVLDISYIQNHDSGEYVCKASNLYGEDYTKATISAYGRGGVYSDSLQPDSLARIRELESQQGQQPQTPTTPVAEPPKFITQISDITKLVEGQSAHFEARLTPVTDPDLKVEWYYNGKKLPHGHRYRTFHDFGIVILDILYCYEENSGVYECRAVNKYGEDSTKATLKCVSKANLILDSQLPRGMEGGLEKIQTLEDSLVRTREERETEAKGKAPVFTVPLSNIEGLKEGENAHFEARLTPTDDPKLKVEWFWNGKPLKAGSRFRTFCDFGFVILEISPIYPEDSGEYSCRAFNDYGEAVTTASMKIQGKRSIILESQLPKGMEGTIDKIAELEGLGAGPHQLPQEDDSGKPPEFITTPSDLTLTENSLAHFECRLTPVNDPSMRVEWYHNGKPLLAGSRVKTINDFGFVILEISGCYQRESGLYTCKATNKHGEATVSCKLQVRGRTGIVMEPQLPSNFRSGTESIQKLEESLYKRDEILAEEEKPNPPKFTVELKDNLDVPEGGPIHFDCRVEPVGDPTMRIDWFHNGRPFATGSRVHMLNDFGFIALDMDYTYIRDSGEYICRATNKWGSATTKASITIKSKRSVDFESQLPTGMSAEKLKDLERGPVSEAPKEDAEHGPPRFTTQIQSATVEESEAVRFECHVEPKDDPNLRIEWYRNGKPLPSGHRYRTVYDMGFVSLDILYVYEEDSGEYVCRAVNKYGEDRTIASISCKKLPSIILQNQVPKGMKKSETLMQMEATIKKYTSEIFLTEDDLYDPDRKQPPRFVTQIQDQTSLVEMQSTKFECQLAPVGDPNMKVEWFFNGKPLPHKNRFTPIYDFGYVAMNFGWVYPEDSGEYLCRATNLYGMDETRAIIKTAGKPGIIYESQLPKGMKSIEKIREMEAAWQVVPDEAEEEAKPRCAPIFVSRPEPVTVEEGDWSRFCCRVTGHPRPRVMWLINGHTIVNGSRYKLTYDGMYHLDIPKTRQYDNGVVEVIARSSVGEALATTELKVVPRHDDYRGVLKNSPRPWYDYSLTQYQKDRETELERVFDERTQQERTIITGDQFKPKVSNEPETEWQQSVKKKKNEDYYSKIQELENEQVIKEARIREANHQLTIPGEKIVNASVAKGMAQRYQDNLEQKPEQKPLQPIPILPKPDYSQQPDWTKHQLKKTQRQTEEEQVEVEETQTKKSAVPPSPTESGLHAKEIHVAKQKQTQKETKGDLEITRKITATETTEMEHKNKTTERVVQGQVLPSTPPVFTKKIQPCRAFENERARFEVEYDGDPLPTIKWFREDCLLKSSPDFQIHTMSTKSILVLRQVMLEDSGVFSVIAENRGGTAKCSANLVVEQRRRTGRGGVIPPNFISTIHDANVPAGQLVRFDARIQGTKPLDVYWLKNGKKITPDIRYKTLEEDNTYTLIILEVVPEDAAKYECVAINNAGEARCEAECVVQAPQSPKKTQKPSTPGAEKEPIIAQPLKNQIVKEGQAIAFKCKIVGKPTPTITWQKGDKTIKPSKYFQMMKEGDNCILKISEAFPEDEGVYTCIATNPAGTNKTSATLKVAAPDNQDVAPSLTPMKDVIVQEGNPAQFKTQVAGKPKPSIQWLREGVLIPESQDFQTLQEGNNVVLLIATTYEEDSGIFTCRATSSAGQVETSARLTVKKRTKVIRRTTTKTTNDEKTTLGTRGVTRPGDSTEEGPGLNNINNVEDDELSEEIELPQGDETLPWRIKKADTSVAPWRRQRTEEKTSKQTLSTTGTTDEKLRIESQTQIEKVKQETKPWTHEPIKLKPTIPQKKEIPKETLEDVTLKPSKIQKGVIEKETLETVNLKTFQKAVEETTITTQEETVQIDSEQLISVEDSEFLKIKKETDELSKTKSKSEPRKIIQEAKPWTEEPIKLKPSIPQRKEIPKETLEEVTLKPYKIQKKTIDLESLETVDLKPLIKTADETNKITLEDTLTQTSSEQIVSVEDSELLKLQKETDEFTKTKPQPRKMSQEAKPWTEEPIKLKPATPQKKEIPKETLEEVKLKPSKIQKSVVEKESLETVDLKSFKKTLDETVTSLDETIVEAGREQIVSVDDSQFLQVQTETDEFTKTKTKSQPRKMSQEAKPWTEEPIKLKPATPQKKEIPKETLEEIKLKPSKIQQNVVPKESLETVDLKPYKKPIEETAITTEDQTTVSTNREQVTSVEDTQLLKIQKETDELTKSKIKPQPRKMSQEAKPWTEEPIKLKPATPQKKEIPKETLEEVKLKPFKIQKSVVEKESLETVDLKPFKKTLDETVTSLDETIVEDRREQIVSVDDSQFLQVQTETDEFTKTKTKSQPRKMSQEAKPWTEEPIKLKPATPQKKEIPKETLEEIKLKPSKIQQNVIPKESLETVDLKPYKKPIDATAITTEDQTTVSTDREQVTSVEDTELLKIQKETDELAKTKIKPQPRKMSQEAKPWTEEPIKLKPAAPQKKEIPKETLEEVSLKPSKIQKSVIEKESLETVDLKPFKKTVDETVSTTLDKTIVETDKQQVVSVDDSEFLKLQKETDEFNKIKIKSQPRKMSQEEKSWTEEPIKLKPATPQKKEIPKETIEEIKLKPSKVQKNVVLKDSLETVDLKPFQKIGDKTIVGTAEKEIVQPGNTQIVSVEDIELLKIQTESDEFIKTKTKPQPRKMSQEVKPWTEEPIKLKPAALQKKEVPKECLEIVDLKPLQKTSDKINEAGAEKTNVPTEKVTIEDSELLEIKQENDELTKLKTKPKPQPRKMSQENKPWTDESIKLKPTTTKKKEIQKEALEDVTLRPVKVTSSPEETLDTVKPIEKILKEAELVTPESTAPWRKPKEEKPTTVAPWRKPKPDQPEPSQDQVLSKSELVEEIITEVEDTIVLEVDKSTQETPPAAPWRKKSQPMEENLITDTKWPTGKIKLKEAEKPEEATLKPIPKKKPEEKPKEEISEPVELKPVSKTKEIEEVKEKKWPTGKRRPKEEEKPEEVTLKPIPKKKPEEKPKEEISEPVDLKPIPKTKEIEEVEEKQWPTGKRRPKEEVKPEEVTLKPIPKQKQEEKPKEEISEPVELKPIPKTKEIEEVEEKKWPTGKRRPKEESKSEEVILKPIPKKKPEEKPKEDISESVELKPIPKTKQIEEVQEKKWPTGKRRPKEEAKPEEVTLKPIPKKKPEEKPIEEIPEPVDRKPIPKTKEIEEVEEKKWPTGKRRPKEEEKPEEVTLKPIPKQKQEEKPKEEIFEPVDLKPISKTKEVEDVEEKKWPTGKRRPKEEVKPEEVTLKPIPKKKPEEKPKEDISEPVDQKPISKTKEIDEVEENKWSIGKRRPKEEEKPEEVTLKPIPKQKQEEKPKEEIFEPVDLKPISKTKEVEDVEEKKWPTGKRRPKEEVKPEEVTLKPIPKKKPEEKPKEDISEPVDQKPISKTKEIDEVEENKWSIGKRRPKEEEKPEEVTLKPIPKKKPEEKPKEEISEPVDLKPISKTKEIEEVVEKKWPTGKRRPKEEEKPEEVTLKPIPKKKTEEKAKEEIPEPVELKVIPKTKEIEEVEEKKWPTGKRRPKEEEKPEEVTLKPIPKKKREEKPKEEKSEPVDLQPIPKIKEIEEVEEKKWPTGKRRPKEEEKPEEITLKSIPKKKTEEKYKEEISKPVELKPILKTKEIEEVEEKKWPTGKRRPKEESKPEEVTLKPIPKKKQEEKPKEEISEPIDLKPIPKTKETEEVEEKKWPTGKRRPKEESKPEEVTLKPIPKKKPEEKPKEEKPEPVDLKLTPKTKEIEEVEEKKWPTGKRRPKEEEKPEEVTLKPIPKKKPEEKPKEEISEPVDLKPISKTKEVEDVEEKKWPTGKRRPKEEVKPEEVTLKPIPKKKPEENPEEEISEPVELKPISKTKQIEEVEEKNWPIPKEKSIEVEDEQVDNMKSDSVIILQEKKIVRKSIMKTPSTETIEDESQITQATQNIKIDSKKKVKKRVVFDNDQPLGDLEIVSEKKSKTKPETVSSKTKETTSTLIVDIKEQKKVKKSKAPRFIQRLQPVTSELNQPVKFVCEVEGMPFPEISWFKNEVELHASEHVQMSIVENTVTLEIAEVKPQDVSMYSCRATNSAGVATSTANLIILEKEDGIAPHFTLSLKPQIAEEHTTAQLECYVVGQPTPVIKWFKGNDEIKPDDKNVTEYNPKTGHAVLEIAEVTKEDTSIFRVCAENKFGKAESRANLIVEKMTMPAFHHVKKTLKITKPLKAVVTRNTEPIILEAEFEATPIAKVKWHRNNKEIKPSEDIKIETSENTSKLILSEKLKQKTGRYELRIENEVGEARTSASVAITEEETTESKPPRFIKPIEPQIVTEGEVVIIEAIVDAYPTATFQWYQENVPIKSSNEIRIATDNNKSILYIPDIPIEFAGNYTCRAENVAGSVTCTANINILEEEDWQEPKELLSPRFVKQLSPIRVMDGEKVTFTCKVLGKPVPKVEWRHNNRPIKEAQGVIVSQDTEGVCFLAITEVFPEDAGNYTCVATNKVGEAICTSNLVVEAYEYVPDSEIGLTTTAASGSEEDLLKDAPELPLDSDSECAPKIVKKLPEVITTKDGDVIRLEVKAEGKPKPEGKWIKQDVEIIPSEGFLVENFEDGTSVLTITEVYPDDTGEITFEAYNPLGVAITTTELSVEGIVGTKEYRKPEWVTHMEELQAILKGSQI